MIINLITTSQQTIVYQVIIITGHIIASLDDDT